MCLSGPDRSQRILILPSYRSKHYSTITSIENSQKHLALALAKDPVDCVVGFNKMPGLDIYYAADSCYEEKARSQRGWLYRHMSRYKHFSAYESSVFSSESQTEIMSISDVQKPYFIQHYSTQEKRFHTLPPGLPMTGLHPRTRPRSVVIKGKNLV